MIAYALIVTFVLGSFVGSLITLVSAFRSSECCPMCSEPILKLIAKHRDDVEPNPILIDKE